MKKIIKIENESVNKYKVVEWKLHNVCNYDCSFCHSSSKVGDQRFLDPETYYQAADKLMSSAELENKKIRFFITGGEPTLLPIFPELILRIKQRGHFIRLNTNGSRTLRWWSEFIQQCGGHSLDYIVLSVHVEQGCNLDHIIKVTELYKNLPTVVLCSITAPPYNWYKSIDAQQILIENSISYVHLRGIFEMNNKLMDYTPEQLLILKNEFLIPSRRLTAKKYKSDRSQWEIVTATFDDGNIELHNGQYFVNSGLTSFFGYQCSIGQHRLMIDYKTVYKGVCRQDGAIGTIENLDFAETPTICTKNGCMCGADVIQPKVKNL